MIKIELIHQPRRIYILQESSLEVRSFLLINLGIPKLEGRIPKN